MSDNYNYTVPLLLHAAGRYRREHCGRNLVNCRCEDDHVIELRLVVAALNQLPDDTYTARNWQMKLVEFFDDKYQNSMFDLSRRQCKDKSGAVERWLDDDDDEDLTDAEMGWIDEIRETWADNKDHLQGFGQFKTALDDILGMDTVCLWIRSVLPREA